MSRKSDTNEIALLEKAVEVPGSTFVWGPPGVGKTYAAREAFRKFDIPDEQIFQLTLTEDYTVQELMGHFLPGKDGFVWNYGPVSKALTGGALIVNELARASGPVQDFFLGVLDSEDTRQIDLPNGERITSAQNPAFRVVATANTGPDELDEALADRFGAYINLTSPAPSLITHLEKQYAGLGEFIKNSYRDPDRAVSPRRALAFLRLKERMEHAQAAKLAFGARAKDAMMVIKTVS